MEQPKLDKNISSSQNINSRQNKKNNTEIKKDNNKDKIINNNQNNEIDLLKKEILELKSQREQDLKNYSELKLLFQTEITKLQTQIKSLSEEITSLKPNQKKKESNNIINKNNRINIEDNDENINMEEDEDDKLYSLECLSRKLNIDITQGTDKAKIDIAIKNNSDKKYPKNSFLICDQKNSLLLCENVELGELDPNQQKIISIIFKNLKYISKGEYKCLVKLMVEDKVYNLSAIELTINVIAGQNIRQNNNQNNNFGNNLNNMNNSYQPNPFLANNDINNINNNNQISSFRQTFSLFDYETITDDKIQEALLINNNDFNKAFESLYN